MSEESKNAELLNIATKTPGWEELSDKNKLKVVSAELRKFADKRVMVWDDRQFTVGVLSRAATYISKFEPMPELKVVVDVNAGGHATQEFSAETLRASMSILALMKRSARTLYCLRYRMSVL